MTGVLVQQEKERSLMVEQQAQILRPETLIQEFKKNGVTHVITLPDSETDYLYEMMVKEPSLEVIPVSREGETMSTALGPNVAGEDEGRQLATINR